MSTPAAQHPDYLASLGLQRAPFLDQIDDRFFYADPQLAQRLDLLQHLIQFGDMLLGVSGPAGSGKSTLLQQLLRRGTGTWRSCRLNGGQLQQPADLLAQLAEGFGLDRSAAPERLKADLLRLFQTLRHTSLIPVLAIDDAQLLPDPAFKALLELGGEPRETLKLLRIVMFSEPGLEQRLIQAGWHSPLQPLLHNLDLPRFDDHQTAAYLMYRLAAAGYSGESPFSLTEIRALHKAADGLPGRLNVLAHETLMDRASRLGARRGAAETKPGASRRRPALILGTATGILILGALGGYLLTRLTDGTVTDVQNLPESAPEPAAEDTAETAVPAPDSVPETPELTESQTDTATAAPQDSDAIAPVTPPPASEPTAAGSAADSGQAAPATLPPAIPGAGTTGGQPNAGDAPAPGPAVAPATADADAGTPAASPSATAPSETATGSSDQALAPATASAEQSSPTAAQQPAAANGGATATESETKAVAPEAKATEPPQPEAISETPAAAPTPPPAAAVKPAPPPINLPAEVLQADWLLERPASHFTLQLLAVRNPDSLRGYLRDHAIPAPVAVFRARLKGSDWYVLVQGDYPDMNAARAAVAGLPAAVRKSKPWPRSFVSVHTDIRKTSP